MVYSHYQRYQDELHELDVSEKKPQNNNVHQLEMTNVINQQRQSHGFVADKEALSKANSIKHGRNAQELADFKLAASRSI
jgi:hypothetical protein